MIRLSVLLCTHNPHPGRLARCLEGLRAQTLAREAWELVVIDNASVPPLTEAMFRAAEAGDLRVIQEAELGLTPARLAGIAAAQGDVLVFVDDDNVLAPNYLANALAFFDAELRIGAAGGILEGEFEVPPPQWMAPHLNLLGIRDFGPRPIQALIYDQVGPWEPIGAGMVVRLPVARHYARIAVDPRRRSLDRRGRGLASCGDTDMARCAPELGFALAYEPSLRLLHLMPAARLRYRYMLQLVHGIKRSGILLDRIRTGRPAALPTPLAAAGRFLIQGLRLFSPNLRQWLLALAALRGEIQARRVRLET
jgi:glycosyltransferase involved in cell wall biosynthesis